MRQPCHAALTPAQIEKAMKAWQARENARKYGYSGATFVLDEEDKQAYAMHLHAYFESLIPRGTIDVADEHITGGQ